MKRPKTTIYTRRPRLIFLLGAALLIGCGGGGGGNSSQVTPPANTADTTAPEVSLNGPALVELSFGSVFQDPGASATDDRDGALPVSVEGQVDRRQSGEQTLSYRATDAAGNTATTSRIVRVGPRPVTLAVSRFGEGEVNLIAPTGLPDCLPAGESCNYQVSAGTTLIFEAVNASGFSFNGWDFCDEVAGRQCRVTVQRDASLLATFASEEPLMMVPEALELSGAQLVGLLDYDPEQQDVLAFSSDVDLGAVIPGTILVSNGLFYAADDPRNIDIYFARRVVEILPNNNGRQVLRTQPVSLDELFESGTLIVGGVGGDSNSVAMQAKSSAFTVDIPVRFTLSSGSPFNFAEETLGNDGRKPASDLDRASVGASAGGAATIGVDGTLRVTVQPTFSIDFGRRNATRVREIRAMARISVQTLDGGIDLNIGAGVGVELRGEVPEIPLPRIPVGPVVISPSLTPFLYVGAGADVEIVPKALIGLDTEFGVVYKRRSGWTPVGSQQTDLRLLPPEQVTGRAYVEAGFGLELFLALYEVAGPTLSITPYTGIDLRAYSPPQNACIVDLEPYFGVKAEAGGQLDLFVFEQSFALEIFDERIPGLGDICLVNDNPPSAPGQPALAATPFSFQLDWTAAQDDIGVAGYRILRSEEGGPYAYLGESQTPPHFERNLVPGRKYCYRVSALDSSENESAPSQVCATAIGNPEPLATAPSTPQAQVLGTSAVDLSWSSASQLQQGEQESFYLDIQRQSDGVMIAQGLSTRENCLFLNRPCGPTAFRVTGLNAGTEYCFSLRSSVRRNNVTVQSDLGPAVCATTRGDADAEWVLQSACVPPPLANEGPGDSVPVTEDGIVFDENLDLDIEEQADGLQTVRLIGEGIDRAGVGGFRYILDGRVVDGIMEAALTLYFNDQATPDEEPLYETWTMDLRSQQGIFFRTDRPDPTRDGDGAFCDTANTFKRIR